MTTRVGVVGASGYTGAELLRILWSHPGMEVTVATANQYAGERIHALYPSLKGFYDGEFAQYDAAVLKAECDVVFLCLPGGESMAAAPELLEAGLKVVDLSADFRFDDPETYWSWYGIEHTCPGLLEEAVYGLPEINREAIAGARLVANPGCYPTASILGLYPLASEGLLGGTVIIDAKSGVSGAGRGLTLATHFPQAAEAVSPYAVAGHRHLPEIELHLKGVAKGAGFSVAFTPHLVPMNRGILVTMYVGLDEGVEAADLRPVLEREYEEEPFVELLPPGAYPSTKSVWGSNNCQVALEAAGGGETVVVMSVIDNLVKGASGQAVQCMNLMTGDGEGAGLSGPGLSP